jgi:hypothetical protein
VAIVGELVAGRMPQHVWLWTKKPKTNHTDGGDLSTRPATAPAADDDIDEIKRAVLAKPALDLGKDVSVATDRDWFVAAARKVPIKIKELAKSQPADYARQFQEPTEVGGWAAGRLITEIVARDLNEGEDPRKLPPNLKFPGEPPEWGHHRTILRYLGSGWKRRGERP